MMVDSVHLTYGHLGPHKGLALLVESDAVNAQVFADLLTNDTSQFHFMASADFRPVDQPQIEEYVESARLNVEANYQWQGEHFATGQFSLDTLGFKLPQRSEAVFVNTDLTYHKADSLHSAHLQFVDGQYANVRWHDPIVRDDSLDLISAVEHIDINFWLDSLLHGTLGEDAWTLALDTLQVDYDDGNLAASLFVPHLSYADYALDSLTYTFRYAEGEQRGLLAAAHLKTPPTGSLNAATSRGQLRRDGRAFESHGQGKSARDPTAGTFSYA